jgi:hypothetical protein
MLEPDCVASALAGQSVEQQIMAPGQPVWVMVVTSGPGSLTGFRAVRVGYRSGLVYYTTVISQGAFACVAVPAEQCPDDPWVP